MDSWTTGISRSCTNGSYDCVWNWMVVESVESIESVESVESVESAESRYLGVRLAFDECSINRIWATGVNMQKQH